MSATPTTPQKEESAKPTPPAEESAKPLVTKFTTYEEGVKIVAAALAVPDIAQKDDALRSVEAFFNKRIAKKSSSDEKEGLSSVKRALESNRKFKPFDKPPAETPVAQAGGGMFA